MNKKPRKIYRLSQENIDVYHAIIRFWQNNMYSPSIMELVEITDKAKTTIIDHLRRLERAGWIKMDKGHSRTIRPTGMEISIPVLKQTEK